LTSEANAICSYGGSLTIISPGQKTVVV
jgi:hypothetical protein